MLSEERDQSLIVTEGTFCHRGDFSVTEGTFVISQKIVTEGIFLSQRGLYCHRKDIFLGGSIIILKEKLLLLKINCFNHP